MARPPSNATASSRPTRPRSRLPGESASTFFHACWWHTAVGEKTPIQATPSAKKTGPVATKPANANPANAKQARRSEPASKPLRHLVRWHERGPRLEDVRRAPHGNEDLGPDPVGPSPAYVGGMAALPLVPAPTAQSPLIETIPVTVVGVPNMVVLSVPAGTSAMVRDVLNHPAVPGLTAAP